MKYLIPLMSKISLITALLLFSPSVMADYWLITIDLETEVRTVERFISQSDCRARGERNLDLARLLGKTRVGFMCVPDEEQEEVKYQI